MGHGSVEKVECQEHDFRRRPKNFEDKLEGWIVYITQNIEVSKHCMSTQETHRGYFDNLREAKKWADGYLSEVIYDDDALKEAREKLEEWDGDGEEEENIDLLGQENEDGQNSKIEIWRSYWTVPLKWG
jgi:hypothetical protein